MSVCGGDNRLDRPLAIERHEEIAQRVTRRMQGDGEGDLWALLCESLDPWHDAAGRDGDATLPNPTPHWIGEAIDGGEDGINVLQWLTHPHVDHIGQLAILGAEDLARNAHLVLDLTGAEIAGKTEFARGAERAADRAARLAGDTDSRTWP